MQTQCGDALLTFPAILHHTDTEERWEKCKDVSTDLILFVAGLCDFYSGLFLKLESSVDNTSAVKFWTLIEFSVVLTFNTLISIN